MGNLGFEIRSNRLMAVFPDISPLQQDRLPQPYAVTISAATATTFISTQQTLRLSIAGGIVRRYPELFAASRFRAGFENKGSYRSLMERIPTQLIMDPQPGLLGASYVALELFRGTEVMPTS